MEHYSREQLQHLHLWRHGLLILSLNLIETASFTLSTIFNNLSKVLREPLQNYTNHLVQWSTLNGLHISQNRLSRRICFQYHWYVKTWNDDCLPNQSETWIIKDHDKNRIRLKGVDPDLISLSLPLRSFLADPPSVFLCVFPCLGSWLNC